MSKAKSFFFGESNWVEKTNYEGEHREEEDRQVRPKRNVNETASVERKKCREVELRKKSQIKMLSCSFRRLGTYF